MSADSSIRQSESTVEHTYGPSLRPVLLLLAATVVAVGAVAGTAFTAPSVFGGGDVARLAGTLAVVVGALFVVRYAVKAFVLSRTTYVVTDTHLRREYALALTHDSREIPIHQLRGIRVSRNPVQTLLGYGDVEFLTAGPNQSLGFLTFENANDPDARRDTIRELLVEE